MATSNPASISRFAEIGRDEIFREAHRERLALEAVRGRSRDDEVDEADAPGGPADGITSPVLARAWAIVLGLLGRSAPAVGET